MLDTGFHAFSIITAMWEIVVFVIVTAAIIAYVVHYRIQKMKEESEPDFIRMKELLRNIEAYVESLEKETAAPGLPEDVTRALKHAKKVVVVGKNAISRKDFYDADFSIEEGCCIVLVVLRNDQYYKLLTTKRPEHSTRFAKKLGGLLRLPVEMV
ncbi:MAG: hypothetical protein ABIJ56_20750 [Pseudomonadota bacterium]